MLKVLRLMVIRGLRSLKSVKHNGWKCLALLRSPLQLFLTLLGFHIQYKCLVFIFQSDLMKSTVVDES